MDSALTTIGLPIALGIIMFGLGLSLTVQDFRDVRRQPKAVIVALLCQLTLLPAVCFGLVILLDLPPVLAVGMMLLAASPGGTIANLYSHLFRGDVALNVTLTAVNSVLAIITLPFITNLSINYFGLSESVDLQFRKVVEVFIVVLGPVLLGMLVRSRRPAFAANMDRPVRTASAVILSVLVLGVLFDQRDQALGYLGQVGLVTTLFCFASLLAGFFVPRALGVTDRQAIACSFEIGVHNATLAIYVAVEVLGSVEMSIPGAVYGLLMFVYAALWGLMLTRWILPRRSGQPSVP
ncbi:bile acid:sodium symporter [Aeromicrobium sp. PE09-221]|uniref:bile acid:sodium symporter family protein n=1 Tax=Aeromicrobium sp. PE09-221 TaxID=1898043 RepID=UPI000B3EAC52|nr:bile acid:sodium symporter family protein [Aeromicrobium sp. PE09-221]OUZ12773.1 bile acid:sodium symporter [Aeromicrobium sp. PE09-221]